MSKQIWLRGPPSIPQFLCYSLWLCIPCPLPELFSSLGSGLPFPLRLFLVYCRHCGYHSPFVPSVSRLLHPVPLSPFCLPLPLPATHTVHSSAWMCLHWSVPDTPASDCALPHSYSNLSSATLGVLVPFPFLSLFTFRHKTMYITRSNCCQERKRIHSGNRIWEVSQKGPSLQSKS